MDYALRLTLWVGVEFNVTSCWIIFLCVMSLSILEIARGSPLITDISKLITVISRPTLIPYAILHDRMNLISLPLQNTP